MMEIKIKFIICDKKIEPEEASSF